MAEKKIWFIGYTRRFWWAVSIEGWLVTAAFFAGILLIGNVNGASDDASLTLAQAIPVVVEFACLAGALFFVTKGHVDKRY